MPAFSKLATVAAALSGAMAAPWNTASKHSTHRYHLGARDTTFTTYTPPSKYETFETGIDHPLSKRATATSQQAASGFLETKLGLTKDQLKYKTGFTGESATHLYFKQTLNGIEVANGVANVAIKDNKVVAYGANFIKPKQIASSTPKLTSAQAIAAAETHLGAKYNNWPTTQEYVFTDNDAAVLTYVVQVKNDKHWFQAFVDAQTGDVVNVVDFVAEAAYRVVPFTKQDPTWDGFSLIKDPADLSVSPDGWHQDTEKYNTTQGNNVIVTSKSAGTTSQSGPNLVFDYPWDPTTDPSTEGNVKVATTNAFYIANSYHDLVYKYGFTEAAYNFQNINFDKGGEGNDAVQFEVQADGADNAWFATPPDGQAGESAMFLFDLTNPRRDGALSNDIITHEFTHGLTNRMTGGGTGGCLATLEAGGMGEGWSDTMAFWVEANSTTPVDFTTGPWATNKPTGPRAVPYSVNMTVDPYTYSSVSSMYEVHDIGEVWATMLIEVYWALVAAKGYSPNKTDPTGKAGNIVFLHLFVDALPIQPCSPTFTDARNAIIQADVNRYAGENRCTLWKAFAKRGLGVKAAGFTDDFTVPSGC